MKTLITIILFISLISTANALGIGDPAPDFDLTATDNKSYKLSDYAGKVVYIYWFGYG